VFASTAKVAYYPRVSRTLDLNSRAYRIAVPTLLVLMSTGMFYIFLETFELNGDPRSTLIKLMTGTANRPFVYRVLIPNLIRVLSGLLPLPTDLITLILMWLCLVYFAFTFRIFARRFIAQPVLADAASLLALVGLYPSFYFGKIYDFAILFLFTLALVWMHAERWKPYLILFPIACLTKETTALLGLVFALHFFRTMERRKFIALLAYQAIVFLIIRLIITWVFRDNPGNALEFHLLDHVKAFTKQPIFFSLWFMELVIVALVVAYRWKQKPAFLRHAGVATALPLLLLFFTSGGVYELRNLYESYPVVFLLVFFSFIYWAEARTGQSFDSLMPTQTNA